MERGNDEGDGSIKEEYYMGSSLFTKWEISDGCKWVFIEIQKWWVNREAQRYAGWWGFTQTYGADCQETFSPVAKMNSFWVLISCAVNMRWILEHIDVTNAFLHWDLKEEVFMEIPPGFSNKIIEGKVCKLEMVLYGLK